MSRKFRDVVEAAAPRWFHIFRYSSQVPGLQEWAQQNKKKWVIAGNLPAGQSDDDEGPSNLSNRD